MFTPKRLQYQSFCYILFLCCLFAMVSLFKTPHCHHRITPGSDPSGARSYCRPWPRSPPRRSRRRSAPLRRNLGKRCDLRRSASIRAPFVWEILGIRLGEVRNSLNHHVERQTFSNHSLYRLDINEPLLCLFDSRLGLTLLNWEK